MGGSYYECKACRRDLNAFDGGSCHNCGAENHGALVEFTGRIRDQLEYVVSRAASGGLSLSDVQRLLLDAWPPANRNERHSAD